MSNEREIVTLNYLLKRFGSHNVDLVIYHHFPCLKVFDGSKFRFYRAFTDLFDSFRYLRIK